MADTTWPIPKFNFTVSFGDETGDTFGFQEVSGLDVEAQVIEYRSGNMSPAARSGKKLPGLLKHSNVTLKRGVYTGNDNFEAYRNEFLNDRLHRDTVLIQLLDEQGEIITTWTLNNAFATKVTYTDMKADANEVAIETVEIAFETMDVA